MELTIQQKRAKFALERIQGLQQRLNPKEQIEFISYASSLPAMIHMNGLGQAMAFCKLKSNERRAYDKLYQLVSDWLCQSGQTYQDNNNVLEGITQCNMAKYQLAQAESLVFMSWVKKFSKAFLDEGLQ